MLCDNACSGALYLRRNGANAQTRAINPLYGVWMTQDELDEIAEAETMIHLLFGDSHLSFPRNKRIRVVRRQATGWREVALRVAEVVVGDYFISTNGLETLQRIVGVSLEVNAPC